MTETSRLEPQSNPRLSPPAWYFLKAMTKFTFSAELRLRNTDIPPTDHVIPKEFCGVCVATSPDPVCDTYVIERLKALGVSHVRVDYSYDSPGQHSSRLLGTLLNEGFKVMLHLVQPLPEAMQMRDRAVQQRWQKFVANTLDTWGHEVEIIEVGSTINRRRWAGYCLKGFIACWQTAFVEAHKRGLRISGPNISDFEPLYTIALLDLLKDLGQVPQFYTDNLFVERVTQPEVYDHRIFGAMLASLVRYNLVRKARQLEKIASKRGVEGMICSYVSWTLPRIKRFLPEATTKQADYLTRYLVLAAASGAFKRVYWGALVSCREGLIDEVRDCASIEEIVTYYSAINGNNTGYQIRPAFHALQTFQKLIPGSTYHGSLSRANGLEVHEFTNDEYRTHVVWSMNGLVADFSDIYPDELLPLATWLSRDGDALDEVPSMATESPIYLRWPIAQEVTVRANPALIPGISICTSVDGRYYHYRDDTWHGIVLAANRQDADKLFAELHPERIEARERHASLRNSRNSIWTVQDPRDAAASLVIKQPVKLSWNKKLIEPFKPSKAHRSWNGACELLRRGIPSPQPVAYFERTTGTDLLHNWYICELEKSKLSARHFFEEYASGATAAFGVSMTKFLQQLCVFILDMHRRGVFFRDLSGGNVLVRKGEGETVSFTLIDTARAHFYSEPLPLRKRLSDLSRLLYKLHWDGRMQFLHQYFADIGKKPGIVHKLPFVVYEIKTGWKRSRRKKKAVPSTT
ncbi:MAG: lipopolysaccharide kinase InaA family protein [Gammaproteobacteria bacterium]|nr:lipopolysaccharide kinase InaA family protein [Gammaproteobacteria bacterium]MDP2346191.1 lipopolysaccharide kinase InaA family protein [Gammaproteobacteria bacterium]